MIIFRPQAKREAKEQEQAEINKILAEENVLATADEHMVRLSFQLFCSCLLYVLLPILSHSYLCFSRALMLQKESVESCFSFHILRRFCVFPGQRPGFLSLRRLSLCFRVCRRRALRSIRCRAARWPRTCSSTPCPSPPPTRPSRPTSIGYKTDLSRNRCG